MSHARRNALRNLVDLLVVDMFKPKHNLAILMRKSSGPKLFKMFPFRISSALRNGDRVMAYLRLVREDDEASDGHEQTRD